MEQSMEKSFSDLSNSIKEQGTVFLKVLRQIPFVNSHSQLNFEKNFISKTLTKKSC